MHVCILSTNYVCLENPDLYIIHMLMCAMSCLDIESEQGVTKLVQELASFEQPEPFLTMML